MTKRIHGDKIDQKISTKNSISEVDRISQLPDEILHHILTIIPLGSAMRTSVLSRRWNDACKCFWGHTTNFDFGEEFYDSSKTLQEFVETINRYLQLHIGIDIESFRLSFCPGDRYRSDFEKWIGFAIDRKVRVLSLDFRHPYPLFPLHLSLFACDSLTVLKLTYCEFDDVKSFKGFNSLKVLYLTRVHMTDDTIEFMLVNCPVLEKLTLWDCKNLKKLVIKKEEKNAKELKNMKKKISSANLELKRLTVVNCSVPKIEISAPNLLSFHFNGDFPKFSFHNVSSVEDAIVTSLDPTYDFYNSNGGALVLSKLAHVQILTICTVSVGDIVEKANEGAIGNLPTMFPNLKELQIIVIARSCNCLTDLYAFFRYCSFPCLEKLFIELQTIRDIGSEYNFSGPSELVFYHLKTIKMKGFCGNENEMQLVKFLLEKAIFLESLILVTPKKCNEATLKPLHKRLQLLPKASLDARLVLYKHSEDDNSLCPAHTEVYDWM